MRQARLKRVTIVCSTLCLVAIAFWIRSLWWSDLLGVNSTPPGGGMPRAGVIAVAPVVPSYFTGIGSSDGAFYLVRFLAADFDSPPTGHSAERFTRPADVVYDYDQARFAGFRVKLQPGGNSFVGVPCWVILIACAWPAISRHLRARRQPPPGHCPQCGYDVRATPNRCPECAWQPSAPPST